MKKEKDGRNNLENIFNMNKQYMRVQNTSTGSVKLQNTLVTLKSLSAH